MPEDKKDIRSETYTTTFSIPIWLGDKLKDYAEEHGFRGMNRVVEIACINHFMGEKVRRKHNEKINELLERGSITPKEKEELWLR